jgi:ATP-dependent helicase/nuclease subunit B
MRGESEKPEGAVELLGWLELLWEDAPHLVVGGMNDGCVPEAVVGDAFLPETLREKLGLKGNAERLARDAYLLEALACSRGAGRLELLLGKTSAVGEPKMPSRLLFRCEDADLPGRAEFLFRQLDASRPHLPWTRAWRLEPREAPPQATVAVTALRDWLKCPFRFYLQHVLRMAPVEVAKTELDGLDFGTLCHEVLETMGRDGRWLDCTDAGALEDFLSEELERRVRASLGTNLALPLVIQRDAARRRLGTAARAQARERAAGWRIDEVEKRIEIRIGGLWVRGQVDRVDRHVETGAVRVLDYKTADIPKTPPATHLRSLRRDDPVPNWARCEVGGRARAWSDLQLPFYRMGLAEAFPGVSFGYFNLPKALGDTGLEMWEAYSTPLHESAVRCAEGVCEAIRRGEFWPPAEGIPPAEDRFASLFHHGAAASVAWRAAT